MLIRVYDNEYPVQLCSVTGDHIRVTPRALAQIACSPLPLGFAMATGGVLALLVPGIYHTCPDLPTKAVYWTGQILATYGLFLAYFALFDFLGRKYQRSYVMITIGFQAFTLMVTLPWAYVITSSHVSPAAFFAQLEMGHFLGHLIIAIFGELLLVLFILPEQMRHLEMQNEIETGQRQKKSIERKGNCAVRLALRGAKFLASGIVDRVVRSSGPNE